MKNSTISIQPARWAGAILTGLALGFAQPKADLWPLAWVAWAPLILAVRGTTPAQTAKLAFAAHYVGIVVALYWIEVVVRVFGHAPFFVSWFPLALLAAYCAAWPTLAVWGARKLETVRPKANMLWTLPVFLVTAEWVRGKLFTGFPWGHPAYALYKQTSVIQVADLAGIDGLMFLLVLSSVAIVALLDLALPALRRALTDTEGAGMATRRALTAAVAAAIIAGALGYGQWRVEDVRRKMAASNVVPFKVALAQGNIDQSLKWDRRFRDKTLEIYERLSRDAAKAGAEMVIWPETSAPFYFEPEYDDEDSLRVVGLTKEMKSYLFFGAPAAGYVQGKLRSFNRGYLLDTEGREINSYDKAHLVPFSEYIPLTFLFGWIEKLVPVVGNFAMGDKRRALAIPGVRFGPLICYESIFPAEVRDFVADGAQFLTIITNDAWFLRTSAAYQHISMAVLRAAENHVPVLQAGNTGVTAAIAADGTIERELPLFVEDFLMADVKIVKIGSFFTRYGEVFAYVTLLISACLLAWGLTARPIGIKGAK